MVSIRRHKYIVLFNPKWQRQDLRSAASGIFAFFLNLPLQGKVGCGELWSIGSKTPGSCTESVFSVGCRWWRQGTICRTILLLYENMRRWCPFSELVCGLERANTWCVIASQGCFDNHGDKPGHVHYRSRKVESLYSHELFRNITGYGYQKCFV